MWEVVIWVTADKAYRFNFDDREAAYAWANDRPNVYAVEVYGPDGEYDGS
jgi:hypothetical protein